ncbi:MAG: DUF924 domain-containing protein [Alphaproteobacteria bacterium]|nr:DUF924 domain-containing protein [Alphaproteobacteria bacterium]MCB9974050.1 DUF924 domain-containing protein [Rhodospirillales bacterium]
MRDIKNEILRFWFEESRPQQWFQVNESFDGEIRDRFLLVCEMAGDGHCSHWAADADGCLALCLVLDQFPRNIFRGKPMAFAFDDMALQVAREAVQKGFDQIHPSLRRRFLYLPFVHSENLENQSRAVSLFETMKKDDPLGYEHACRHRALIERFGRFPGRNAVLGRKNTHEEQEYLNALEAGAY